MAFTDVDYDRIRDGCQRSAAAIVPIVYDLIRPMSVIDVGCGEGWFAREFAKQGVWPVVGIDPAVEPGARDGVLFAASTDDVIGHDDIFGLAVCLEVAEHLPEEDAPELVAALCESAPVVLFSAAIPGQTGHEHVNRQWPSYWATLFAQHSYLCSDALRWRIWGFEHVEPWYRQNLLLFAFGSKLDALGLTPSLPFGVVHPDIWAWKL